MGLAVASGRVGYAMLSDHDLIDWDVSRVACRSYEHANMKAMEWIDLLAPEVVVTERIGSNPRKRGKTLALMAAVHEAVKQSNAISVTTAKVRVHTDKYAEARALADAYPELKLRLARKPACWKTEPRRMILFEALALALRVKETE